MRKMLRAAIPPSLVSNIKRSVGAPDLTNSLRNLRAKGFRPTSALDIGGFHGHWTRTFRSVFPETPVMIFEPQPDKRPSIEAVVRDHPGCEHRAVVLGDTADTEVDFYLCESGSSVHRSRRAHEKGSLKLPANTLDAEIAGTKFENPSFIKLDVQAHEDAVIRGGPRTFASCEALLIELSIVGSYDIGMLVHEMVAMLAEKGLYLYDITELLRANRTRSVNQIDGLFVREGSPLWEIKHFLPHEAPEPAGG